jgi:hypothetical protein
MLFVLSYQRNTEGFILSDRPMDVFNMSVHYSILLVIRVLKMSFMINHNTNDYVSLIYFVY